MRCLFGHSVLTMTLVVLGGLVALRDPQLRAEQPGDRVQDRAIKATPAEKQAGDVYLNDSFETVDALNRIAKLAKLGRWQEAVELLDTTSKTEGKKLIRTHSGRYTSVRNYINDLIAHLPKTGLSAYRRFVANDARAAFDRALRQRDVTKLVPLFDLFFCTTIAADSASTIGQLAIESGDFDLAVFVYDRVLRSHPDADRYKSQYGTMLRIARVLAGERATEAPKNEIEENVRWFGHDRSIADVEKEIRTRFKRPKSMPPDNAWPVFAGNYQRSSIAQCSVEEPGLLWRYRFHRPGEDDEGDIHVEIPERSAHEASRDLTIFPVVSDGLVVLQRFREVFALHRKTGALAWRFSPDALPTEPDNYLDDRPPGWDSVTIHRGRVYAALPSEDVAYYDYNPSRSETEIVCLDLKSGNLLWRSGETSVGEFGSELEFDSAPVVDHGRLFIVGRRRRSFGFEDCYLYRFRASNGRLVGRVHLASASTATFGSRTATSAIAALNKGTIYVNSGLGTIAAVSAYTGNVKWLTLYERLREDDSASVRRSSRDVRPWQFNPMIYADDRLYALPTDSAALLVLDPSDGRPIDRISVDELGGMDTLLGVDRDVVCGVGKEVSCFDATLHAPIWTAAMADGRNLFGRASWTDNHLLVPFRHQLARYSTSDGALDESPWEATSEGGNLLPLGNVLIVAGVDEVTAYMRKADIWRSLRAAMTAAPDDPLPAIEMAEVAIGAGEHKEALVVLEEAIQRFARSTGGNDPAVRDRLFNDVCKFAKVLVDRDQLEEKALGRLLDDASRHAPDVRAGLRYRLEFARLFERIGSPRRAVLLYHQIIGDRSLRSLSIAPDDVSSQNASAVAADKIARLIEIHGRDVYAQLEEQADRWLKGTRQTEDERLFVRLIETFPNSIAARKTMVAYGRWLTKHGRFDDAVQQLTQAYHCNTDRNLAPVLMREIADAHEHAGSPEHAYRWLTKAMRDFPSFEFSYAGRVVDFQQYRRRLQHVGDRVVRVRPDLHLPLSHRATLDLPESSSLLSPVMAPLPGSSWTTVFLGSADGIRAIDPRTGQDVWPIAAKVPGDARLLLVRDDVVLVETLYQIFAIHPASGALLWTLGQTPPHVRDPGGDWEEGGAIRSVALDGDQLIVSYDDGEMRSVSLPDGTVDWKRVVEDVPVGQVHITRPFIAYHLRQSDHVKLCVLDAGTGNFIGSTITRETRPVEKIFVTIDGRIVLVTSQSISLFDASTRKRRWRFASDGLIRDSSLFLDLDAVYFSQNARTLCRLQLGDGKQRWCNEELVESDDDLTVYEAGNSLIVTSTTDILAVDRVNGMTLWRGTTPDRANLTIRLMTSRYVLAVDVPERLAGKVARAYFYDHRNASGLIPRRGGATNLGELTEIRNLVAIDAGLAFEAKGQLHLITEAVQNHP